MKYNGYQVPKITTTLSDLIRVCDLKEAKAHMKEHKPQLEDYLLQCIEATEEELNIRYGRIFAIEATYYEAHQEPVLYIQAMAYERSTYDDIFVAVFTSTNDNPSICHKFTKAS